MSTGGKKATPKRKKLALAKETIKDLSPSGNKIRGGRGVATQLCGGVNCPASNSKC